MIAPPKSRLKNKGHVGSRFGSSGNLQGAAGDQKIVAICFAKSSNLCPGARMTVVISADF